MTAPGCTVVVLTHNEAELIGEALASVQGWACRTIVVDSGSSDATRTIAEQAGAEVWVRVPPPGPFLFTEQRNWALDRIGAGWVLFLDADERATPKFLRAVGAAIRDSSFDGHYLAPKFMYQGTWLRHFTGFPNWHPRLVNADRCRLTGGVWESFPDDARVGHIDEPYVHYPNSKGFDDWARRHLRYATWEARERPLTGDERRRALHFLARVSGPLRPLSAIVFHLFVRRGLFDGGSVWSYARRRLIYELMIGEARRERVRDAAGKPR